VPLWPEQGGMLHCCRLWAFTLPEEARPASRGPRCTAQWVKVDWLRQPEDS